MSERTRFDEWIEEQRVIMEAKRRLSRYDEAIRLLRELSIHAGHHYEDWMKWAELQVDPDAYDEALVFLADEPKPEEPAPNEYTPPAE